ncbi:hypothetical protein MPL1032_220031 [Mesorhizobium plurifarium]|uniref:Uncharacterized protein n=1 Tax=Mesorhizobium plurifarium TaxID=69974 RepID=A0A0K2VZJ2_MESPL|nr:hypothetical protein MPL1032_220031 [Mesorhizobium plurifarium]
MLRTPDRRNTAALIAPVQELHGHASGRAASQRSLR